jgi:hypothetical protein
MCPWQAAHGKVPAAERRKTREMCFERVSCPCLPYSHAQAYLTIARFEVSVRPSQLQVRVSCGEHSEDLPRGRHLPLLHITRHTDRLRLAVTGTNAVVSSECMCEKRADKVTPHLRQYYADVPSPSCRRGSPSAPPAAAWGR